MTAKMPWFRLHWQTLNYHKLASVAAEADEETLVVFGIWVGLLCIVGRSDPGPDGGRLLVTAGRPATIPVLAREIGLDPVRLGRIMDLLVQYGSLVDDDGVWTIKNWGEYQRASDYSTPRVRAWRAKKKAEAEAQPTGPRPAPLGQMPTPDGHVQELIQEFTRLTGIFTPPTGDVQRWANDWLKPTGELLGLAGGDLETAKGHMTKVVELMRDKGLKITRPGSLVNVTRRWLGELAWELIAGEVARVGYTGRPDLVEEMDRAIHRAGGWQFICTAPADQAQERFVRAYLGGLNG